MESGAAGISHDEPDSDAPEVNQRMAMALLDAHEQERSRLAEELHDGPAQALANAIFQTELVDRAVREDPEAARTEILALRKMLERELDTLRGYINQLRPSLGEADASLDDALTDSVNAMSQRSAIPVDLQLGADDGELPSAARTVVLRVAQEALRNIAKHSGATRAWVRTYVAQAVDGRRWVLEVEDNGHGFDMQTVAANPNRRHFGLRFMRERSDLLGSQLSFQTNPDSGTLVRLTIDPREERSQEK
ncbi:MAG TPA: sensor histidine kinase [Candidatus Limnocylindrales bacterium]|jgi:two-component system sensor histidine kinase DegS